MADIRAAASGDFSATATWIGGVVPGSGDVAYANSFTVTISDTRTVQAISNAAAGSPVATVGGTFSLLNGCNLTCTNANGVVQGATATSCVTTPNLSTGQSASVAANISYSGNTSVFVVTHSTSSSLSITGNLTSSAGVASSAAGILSCTGTGTTTVVGQILNTSNNLGSAVVSITGASTVSITGPVTHSGGAVNGGQYCILLNNSLCSVTVTGNVTGSSVSSLGGVGAIVNSAGTLTVNGACQSGSFTPAIGQGSAVQITRLSGPFLLGATGNINPVQAQSWRWAPTQIPTYLEVPTSAGTTKRNLYTADNMPSGGYPVATNVRQSIVYGPNSEFTGSLAVPAPSSVALGVATDNTTGTAILTAANVRSAVGMASANLDTQLSDIPAAVWSFATRTLTSGADSAATIASAVWSAVTRTITGGTVDTLTNAPNVPTAAQIATQVRTELATELARIDAATSSRLAASGYSSPPSAADIRSAVGMASNNLDAQLAQKATVDQVAAIVEAATSDTSPP